MAPPANTNAPKTDAGKFFVPPAEEWEGLRVTIEHFVAQRELVPPLSFEELTSEANALMERNALPPRYREFLIVMLNNALWRDVVASIPFDRRTLLLPPCLRSSASCKAEFDEYGLLCEQCGSCCIGELSKTAESLGYAVLVAEGTSIVGSLIADGAVDAVIGVSCMPSLERTFPNMAEKAIPGLAVPLLQEGCESTLVLEDWVRDLIQINADPDTVPYQDLNQLRTTVQSWFEPGVLQELLCPGHSPTEQISIEWLAKSGKRWRPFLTTAVFQAFGDPSAPIPAPVRTTAIAVEAIHKASLIYDDIQDNDDVRYGESTVHEEHGVPLALTAALYLLGQGYRLLADSGASPATTAAMLRLATGGHCDLCLGQGAELSWMRSRSPLTSQEVLDIFRYKTAPSFDVVLGLGALLAHATEMEQNIIRTYSLALGIAYQVQDDIDDFTRGGDVDDVRMQRPSIVLALAYDAADDEQRETLAQAWTGGDNANSEAARAIVEHLAAETSARELLTTYKLNALHALRPLKNRNLKILLHRLVGKLFK